MQTKQHPLVVTSLGTERNIVSFHYGAADSGEKIYIQASLHADELPGMLVAHHLRNRLAALEALGDLVGEVIVVPVANPVGLSQMMLRSHLGRFEAATGENFNRHYPTLIGPVAERVADKLGADGGQNVRIIRQAMRDALQASSQAKEVEAEMTEVSSMRKVLMALACDADVVLDLHCDANAVLHLYTGTPLWSQCEPLARYLGSYATLLATESGDSPFDEACSQTWWQLAAQFPDKPVPIACLSVTVELRGMTDVSHAQAQDDADRIIDFLQHRGVVKGVAPPLPPLKYPATPLAGSEPIITPVSGVVAYLKKPGDWIKNGEVIVEVINPISSEVHQMKSGTDGVLYAQENRHFAVAGMRLAKVAGATAFRTGKLLSA